MIPDEPDLPEDEELADLLAAYDEAVAAGLVPGPGSTGADSSAGSPRDRLGEDQHVVELLEQLWPRQDPAGGSSSSPAPAQLGRFRVLRELGRGGFGIVYLAVDPKLRRRVALKVPRPEALVTPELRQRFLREGRAAAGLNHRHIVPVHDTGESGSLCYLVSAYCAGGSLAELLKESPTAVTPPAAAELLASLADAIHYAHKNNVLHRDLKPSNILLQKNPKAAHPKSEAAAPDLGFADYEPQVSDFGLAKFMEEEASDTKVETTPDPNVGAAVSLTTGGAARLGTPSYMAPEQAEGRSADVGAATDVYGLGAILYEVLTGRPPFQGTSREEVLRQVSMEEPVPPRFLRRDLPRDLEAVCLKCLEKKAERRYATAAALAVDLRRFLAGVPTRARPAGPVRHVLKWAGRRPAQAALVGLIVLAAAAVFAAMGWYAGKQLEQQAALRAAGKRTQQKAAEALREHERAEQELKARQQLYVLNVRTAEAAWETGQFDAVDALLQAQKPGPGEKDFRGFEWYYLRGLANRRYRMVAQPGQPVYAVALSPDGRLLAIGGHDGLLELWDLAAGKKKADLPGHKLAVFAVAFSPDGKVLAAAGGSSGVPGELSLWDVAPAGTAKLRYQLQGHPRAIDALAFSPDGTTLAVASGHNWPTGQVSALLRLWDVGSGLYVKEVEPFPRQAYSVHSLAWTDGGETLVLGMSHGLVTSLDGTTLQPKEELADLGGRVVALAVMPHGKVVAAGSWDGTVAPIFNKPWKSLTANPRNPSQVWSLAYSPDGKILAGGFRDGSIALWDTDPFTWRVLARVHAHGGMVRGLVFTPDGKSLISTSIDRSVKQWDVAGMIDPRIFYRGSAEAWWTAFAPDGKTLAEGGDDHLARLWDVASGRQLAELKGHSCLVLFGAFALGGSQLVTADWDGNLRWWDPATGQALRALHAHQGAVRSLAVSPDGNLVASGGEDRTLSLWEAATGRKRWSITQSETVSGLDFPKGGNVLAAGDGQAMVFRDPATGIVRHKTAEAAPVRRLAYSPDGKLLAVGSKAGMVTLRQADTGKQLAVLPGNAETRALAFSPDGRTLAVGDVVGMIHLWHVATGQHLLTLRPTSGTVHGLAFAPDGRMLACACHDGTVMLWLAPAE
jgi:WD40 repeat protein